MDATATVHIQALRDEIERTPGFLAALNRFAATGVCGITPPIIGAMVRCGILSNEPGAGAKAARAALALLEVA